jgi:hypothetical protein
VTAWWTWEDSNLQPYDYARATLARCVLHGKRGTFPVIEAETNAVIVAEVVFRQIAVQMLLGAVLIDAAHPALEDREIAFR